MLIALIRVVLAIYRFAVRYISTIVETRYMVAGVPMRYDIKPVMSDRTCRPSRTYRVEDISHSEGVYRKTGRFYIAGAGKKLLRVSYRPQFMHRRCRSSNELVLSPHDLRLRRIFLQKGIDIPPGGSCIKEAERRGKRP